jgi:hypothetical protein
MKLFLDIDGVLVHANPAKKVEFDEDGFYKFNSKAISILNELSIKNVEIVLSSSHRHRFTLAQWRAIFQKRGIRFDEFSIIKTSLNYRDTRRVEIENWIKLKKYKPNDVLIIDDDKSLNGLSFDLKSRLILTNPYFGLVDDFEINRVLNKPTT